jgi:hypothetical protein
MLYTSLLLIHILLVVTSVGANISYPFWIQRGLAWHATWHRPGCFCISDSLPDGV